MEIIQKFSDAILQPIIVLLFALAVLYFVWGLMKFIQNQDNSEEQDSGKRHMVYGVIGIAIMAGVQGILSAIKASVDAIK